ncbi:MAG: alpha-E domain-containing protein [Vulcanimicrobiota bacterium]
MSSSTMLSRVADHLYWIGRYLERAEHTARVLNVQSHSALEESPERRRRQVCDVLSALRQPELNLTDMNEAAYRLALDPDNHSSVRSCIRNARENARHVRERISSEMWEQINKVHLHVGGAETNSLFQNRPQQFYQEVQVGIHLINGLTDSTISRDQAWLFVQVGRWLERAGLLVTLFETYLQNAEQKSYLDWLGLLKCCTAFEAFRKKLGVELNSLKIVDFLILNERFPHALHFSIMQLRKSLDELAAETENRKARELHRLVAKMHHDLEYQRPDEIAGTNLLLYFDRFRRDLQTVHALVYRLYISWEVEF